MGYGFFTDKYTFPAQVKGDIMSEREEKRKARIIDNNLYAAILLHSAGYGVISEGTYSGVFVNNGSAVYLTALEALISQIYVSPTSTLSWTNLSNNTTYYLYATLIEQATDANPAGASSREYKSVDTTTNTTGIIPSNSILVATAITINSNPTGKRMIVTVADHDLHGSGVDTYNDSTFRGDVNIQDTLTVEDPSTFQRLVTFEKDIKLNGGIESGLSIYGADTIVRDDLVVQKTATINQTLTVNDDSTLEHLLIRSGAEVYGNSTVHGDLTITADLVVRGNNNEVYVSAGSGLDIEFHDFAGTKIAYMDGGGNFYLKGQSYNNAF